MFLLEKFDSVLGLKNFNFKKWFGENFKWLYIGIEWLNLEFGFNENFQMVWNEMHLKPIIMTRKISKDASNDLKCI